MFAGLGLSIGTGGTPLTADLIVLTSWDQLDGAGAGRINVTDKVVLMNVPFTSYGAGTCGPSSRSDDVITPLSVLSFR